MSDHLIEPHGGRLIDLLVVPERAAELKAACRDVPSLDLSVEQLCDLELLMVGGFSPLAGFMGRDDYAGVCGEMRLADGTLWPIPVTLDVPEELAGTLESGQLLALRDPEGTPLAVQHVEDVFRPDLEEECRTVYGTVDPDHPGVRRRLAKKGRAFVGGRLEGIERPAHFDSVSLRATPAELRADFARLGWRKVVAFQTRNPMHRAHHELTLRAAQDVEGSLLIHPVVGMTQPGDLDHYTRVRCYRALLAHHPRHRVMLALLPLAMRMAGPKEAVWHAIIRKNYGCTHFIVGRDHAGPGSDASGQPFYESYEAQELLRAHEEEVGVGMVPFRHLVYLPSRDAYVPENEVEEGEQALSISGSELRHRLADGREIPDWFTFKEVETELRRRHPPLHRRGFTIFFTGLSGAGKSTIAQVLMVKLLEMGGRPVTLLDGDIVRKNLSSELGFSKEHRDLNILRIGYVASEITKNGGIAICAPIAPYDGVRRAVRQTIEPLGGFHLVHVATPLEVCESRDRKGLYAKARAGIIKEFTGISDPYEVPSDAEVVLDAADLTPEECALAVLLQLERAGYLGAARDR